MNIFESLTRFLQRSATLGALLLLSVCGIVHAEVSGYVPDFQDSIVLEDIDVFETYGNEGITWDHDEETLLIKHKDPSTGLHSYKTYQLKIVEPEDEENTVEYRLIPMVQTGLSSKLPARFGYVHNPNLEIIDKVKAYRNFMGAATPKKYRYDVGGNRRIGIGNLLITVDANNNDLITLYEEYYIQQHPDGTLVFKVHTIVPEEEEYLDMQDIFSPSSFDSDLPPETNDTEDVESETNSSQPQDQATSTPGRSVFADVDHDVIYSKWLFQNYFTGTVSYDIEAYTHDAGMGVDVDFDFELEWDTIRYWAGFDCSVSVFDFYTNIFYL